ncbi:amidohydrolase family protein [Oscillatoria sp. FACHB-1407]|uniref:amidohydrolase family protein n=1 Tax=Oscillatoria sp. FACHB-1407 TaxID=2692847 RepID=UPI0016820D59|nr:amidohydrolase family protein [Oscillatoria sp. FACHB-1407]MBD2462547.1 amidohydrolase family protein [Oscillatoria sp. FACHB-1407]
MYQGLLVIDADAHKLENPLVMLDYLEPEYRDRIGLTVDRLNDQRIKIMDFNPATGQNDLIRLFPQPEGLGKGGFRNLHPHTTLGAMFNRVRIEQMDEQGIDVQVIYGTFNLTFSCLVDKDLAIALCRAYNNYIAEDCRGYGDRLKPVGVIPLQDVNAAIAEMKRCVNELGMIGVMTAPHLPIPHPKAPQAFPEIRTCKALSHPDFHPLLQTAVDLDIAVGLHGNVGSQLVGGLADHTETFVMTHIFVLRNQQQLALVRMIFDGAFEKFPTLRVGFLEGGCGWLPDMALACHEHWEKRIRDFDPKNVYRPSMMEIAKLAMQERGIHDSVGMMSQVRNLLGLLWNTEHNSNAIEDASLYEHYDLKHRDPLEYFERGQIFVSFESDDPSPSYMPVAMGDVGKRLPCFSADYGHWDGTLYGCVSDVDEQANYDRDHLGLLLGGNALNLYGDRLRNSLPTAKETVSVRE